MGFPFAFLVFVISLGIYEGANIKTPEMEDTECKASDKVSLFNTQGAGNETILVIGDHAADRTARKREKLWLSPPQDIATGQVDLEKISPAAYINKFTNEINISIPEEFVSNVDLTWRRMLQDVVGATSHGKEELQEWLQTGLSNGRPLKLQLMGLPPNMSFPVHAHPNIEMMFELAGSLSEVRLMNKVVSREFEKSNDGSALGPDLVELKKKQDAEGTPLFWQKNKMPKGRFMANLIGSVHQSFTGEDGATLFLLWGGKHANCSPEKSKGVSDLLNPYAGTNHASRI
eukprot:gnl/MRDRNA2_/MRDRNA2_83516_c0_seq1.p1 gnl/MRDRNA2_/MRDRNA2_83516_c0~~gnl/MRDRNA2_/MRDRNA2_83516_c0_seq1.p1  ORF type:complete len:288 (-),score=58.11 gnl/MRDRNA2_/MRDRNA2_83516_c0_seq1:272-1135(-)